MRSSITPPKTSTRFPKNSHIDHPSFTLLNKSDKKIKKKPSHTKLEPLKDNYSYLVFAGYVNNNKKLDLTKTTNLRGVYTSEEHAIDFAKNYKIASGKSLYMISVVFKIKNGDRLDISTTPLGVYYRSAYHMVCNRDTEKISQNEYGNYLKTQPWSWTSQMVKICRCIV